MSCWPCHGNGAEHTLEHTDIALLCALQTTTNTHRQWKRWRRDIHHLRYVCSTNYFQKR